MVDFSYHVSPFNFLAPKDLFKLFGFSICWFWAYLMSVINLLILSITWWVLSPDECYQSVDFEHHLMSVINLLILSITWWVLILSITWWMLSICWFWASPDHECYHLMSVITWCYPLSVLCALNRISTFLLLYSIKQSFLILIR